MMDKIFDTHVLDLQNALSRTTQRQALLTENVANVNVPGYKRKDIDFHSTLVNALGQFNSAALAQRDAAAQRVSDQTSIRTDGNNVDLEQEMTGIADTDLRYQALTTFTTDYFSGLKSAIREGR